MKTITILLFCLLAVLLITYKLDPSLRNENTISTTEKIVENTSSTEMIESFDVKKEEPLKAFKDVSLYDSIALSIHGLTFSGQCSFFAFKQNDVYIATAKHCVPNPKTDIEIWDNFGNKYEISKKDYEVNSSSEVDAALIKISIDLFENDYFSTISNRNLLANKSEEKDTLILVTPFNVRGVKKKVGFYAADNSMFFDLFSGEPGDSGALVVCRDGALGIYTSSNGENNKQGFFVPIDVFEKLYIDFQRK